MTEIDGRPLLEPPAPSRGGRGKRRQVVLLVVVLVVARVVFGGIWLATRHNASTAKVGDCVHQTGTDAVTVVACTDPGADFKSSAGSRTRPRWTRASAPAIRT